MLSTTPLLTLLLLTLAALPAFGQDRESALASELLTKTHARFGDIGKLSSAGTLRATAKASWEGLPGDGRQVESYELPRGRARIVTEFPSFGRFESGSDGVLVWERSPLGITIREGWDASEVLRRYARAQHAPWSEMYASAHYAGEVELDGVQCHRIELAPRMLAPAGPTPPVDPEEPAAEAPPADALYIDAQSHLPVRVEAHARGMDGAATTVEMRYADWREVDGLRFAHHVEVRVSGFVMLLDYESFELGIECPEGFFDPGDEVRAAQAEQSASGGPMRDDEVRRVMLKERHIASIRTKCKHSDIQKTLAVMLPEALAHVMSSGAEMAGQPLVRYHSPMGEVIDLEAAIPVRAPVQPGGRVKAETLPAGEAAITWHIGPYDQLGSAHERVMAWMAEHELEAAGSPWEEYWTDPGMEPDPSKWRTRVVWPVHEKRQPEGGGGR